MPHPTTGALALWRISTTDGPRLARGPVGDGPQDLLAATDALGDLLAADGPGLASLADLPGAGAVPERFELLAPTDQQPVWAAGVTFRRSLDERRMESGDPDVYDRVYDADRPELFFKALPGTSRGPGQPIAVRADSTWDVPEPELTLVIAESGAVVGLTLGNDVSSRSIEAANPLYLPQAKLYDGSCAVGPCIVPVDDAPHVSNVAVRLTVLRDGVAVFEDRVRLSDMHRRTEDLVRWLRQAATFPRGALLMTGTSIVPQPEFTLLPGDEVLIAADGLGTLRNPVVRVGAPLRHLTVAA